MAVDSKGESPRTKSLQSIKLRAILDRVQRDYFYLMYLHWGSQHSRSKDLWEFARRNCVVGLDHPQVDRPWRNVPESIRRKLNRTWKSHFKAFSSLHKGDLVLVPGSQTALLGLGLIKGDEQYKPDLDGIFFRNIRSIDWLVAYEWEKQRPLPKLWGFDKTIQYVGKKSQAWPRIIDYRIQIEEDLLRPVDEMPNSLRIKYGPGGESEDHKRLKDHLYDHPEELDLTNVVDKHREYVFKTGDRADLLFDLSNGRHVVVEVETDNEALIDAGMHQALKYRILKCAEKRTDVNSDSVKSILVAWQQPGDLAFCRSYGIEFVQMKM